MKDESILKDLSRLHKLMQAHHWLGRSGLERTSHCRTEPKADRAHGLRRRLPTPVGSPTHLRPVHSTSNPIVGESPVLQQHF